MLCKSLFQKWYQFDAPDEIFRSIILIKILHCPLRILGPSILWPMHERGQLTYGDRNVLDASRILSASEECDYQFVLQIISVI